MKINIEGSPKEIKEFFQSFLNNWENSEIYKGCASLELEKHLDKMHEGYKRTV